MPSGTGTFGRVIGSVIQLLRAKPSAAEIVAQQEYMRLVNETQDKINRTTPAYVRQQMHYY
jgi:hypothetical protein